MKKENNLTMPKRFMNLTEKEMYLTFGGTLSLATTKSFLDKNYCLTQARRIVITYGWKNVTYKELAKEMYGHAQVYFNWPKVIQNIKVDNEAVKDHCKSIELDNGVDHYQPLWNKIWSNC